MTKAVMITGTHSGVGKMEDLCGRAGFNCTLKCLQETVNK